MSIQKHAVSEQGCPLVMSNGRREASPRRLMSVVAEDDEEAQEQQQPVPKTRSPRMAKACLQEGADGPTVKTSLLSRSPNLEHTSHPSKHAGWKTSKFFSRSMASGELLRGFKKLSFSSSGEDIDRAQNEPRQYKGRLGSLRKRPTSDEIAMANDVASSGSAGDLPKKEKGIVCKKDDIFSIIASVSQSPSSSPATRRTPLRYTKSASFDPTPTDPASFYEPSVPLMCKTDNDKGEGKLKSIEDSEEAEDENVASEDVFECADEDNVPEEESKVQWDDSNVVDAMLLGGAIEAFLKGSMGVGSVEKRVSFKKP